MDNLFTGRTLQLTATLIASLSAISDGMHNGWSAPVIPILKAENSPIKISKNDETWLETINLIGALVGIPVTTYLVNKIGPRKLLLTASAANLLSWTTIALANRVGYLYAARFWGGFVSNAAFVVAPMYISEIAEQKIRGFLASSVYLFWIIGNLVIYSVAPFFPFYVPSIVAGILFVTELVTFPLTPESPYHLLWIGKRDLARATLNKLRTQRDNERELEEIEVGITRQQREKGSLQELLMGRDHRKALIIILLLTAAQNVSGLYVMVMNLHTILLETDSIYFDSNTTAIIFAAVLLVSAIIASFFIDHFGRRVLLISSCVLTGLCLLVLALYFHFKNLGINVQNVSWIPLVCVVGYAAVFNYGLGLVVVVIPAEVLSTKVKAQGMSLYNALFMIFSLLSIEIYQKLLASYGYHVTFYCFTVMTFLLGALFAFIIPETKGKSLEEIQLLLRGHTVTSPTNGDPPL